MGFTASSHIAETELVLIRHGETDWNREGRMQGQLDVDLNPTGRSQAQALARRFAGESFAALYSSDLIRAYDTAALIAAQSRHRIAMDPRLRERHLGVFQGLTRGEAEQRFPDDFGYYLAGDAERSIPHGESKSQRHRRTLEVLGDIARRHSSCRVVVVTHGGILDSLLRHALGIPLEGPRPFRMPNTAVNTFRIRGGRWTAVEWGDLGHLEDVAQPTRSVPREA